MSSEKRGPFYVKRKHNEGDFVLKGDDRETLDLVISKGQHYQTKEPFVSVELWDVVEDVCFWQADMNAEQFQKFKDYINSL